MLAKRKMKSVSPWFLIFSILVMFVLMVGSQFGFAILFDKDVYVPLKAISMKLVAHITGGLVILFLVWREVVKTKTPILKRLGFIKPNLSKLDFLALGLASLAVALLAKEITKIVIGFFPFYKPEKDTKLLYFLEQLTTEWGVLFILVIALAPGFIEEITYRGFLQRGLLKKFRPSVSIVISSFMFGLAHIVPQEIVFTSIMGLWLGIIAWRVNSIWPTIFCHALINGMSGFHMVGKQLWQFPENLPIGYKILVVIAFIYAVKILIQKKNKPEYLDIQSH